MSGLRQVPAWDRLRAHYEELRGTHLRELFAADPERGERLVADGAGLFLDFSKNRLTDETLMLLGELARERGVEERREALPSIVSRYSALTRSARDPPAPDKALGPAAR